VDIIEGTSPTRMDLLQLRKKLKLAVKGHKLLKEKKDALVMEFFNVKDKRAAAREKCFSILARAYKTLIVSEMKIGKGRALDIALSLQSSLDISLDSVNIMGVVVPLIERGDISRGVLERGYGLHDTNAALDRAATLFEEALAAIIELAEIEEALRLLCLEIEKTKRRVNALEYLFIPKMQRTVKYIEMRLDEMERENFFRLKRIKAILAEKE
jgi:V/A-type H+-transporting ATPase subunit D